MNQQLFQGIPLYLLCPFVGFFIAVVGTPIVRRMAIKVGCIDNPGRRKVHLQPTPLWGGVAFSLALIPVAAAFPAYVTPAAVDWQIVSYLIGALFLVALGAADDCHHLGWKIKLAGIMAVTTITIFSGGIVIRTIGTYGTLGRIDLGMWGIPFTYLCVVGVTNAINLVDGLNGLGGGISLVALLFLGIASYMSGDMTLACLCLSLVGALGGFLVYNFPRARIFMGDSGSLLLGFSYSTFAILMSQGGRSGAVPVDPMFPVLVLILPIFDTVRVMIVRIANRRSPFAADRIHFHHLMVRRGYSARATVYVMVAITAAVGTLALLMLRKQTSIPYLVVTLVICLVLSLVAESLGNRKIKLRRKNGKAGEP